MQPDHNSDEAASRNRDGVVGAEASGRLTWSSPVSASLEWNLSGDVLIVRLEGEVCTWSVRRIGPVLHAVIASLDPGAVNIDLSAVTFFDARGVSALVDVTESARGRRRSYQITGSSEASRRVLAACGFDLAGILDATS